MIWPVVGTLATVIAVFLMFGSSETRCWLWGLLKIGCVWLEERYYWLLSFCGFGRLMATENLGDGLIGFYGSYLVRISQNKNQIKVTIPKSKIRTSEELIYLQVKGRTHSLKNAISSRVNDNGVLTEFTCVL